MEKNISQHDPYFRSSMSNLTIARDFLSHHLPDSIKAKVNLNTLVLRKESYINHDLKEKITDVLYSVDIAGYRGYIYLLIEHQSTPDKLMPLRIWQYMCAIMEDHANKSHSKQLPLIVPMVFYNGQGAYPHSTDMLDLFGDYKELAEKIVFKPFKLIDTNKIPDEEIRERVWSG